ncbi:MAG: ABC-2 family transporter protein, partial [Deltaproteobacteria bacterium]|nr:ABC-2 family transporter protein [Deltaproteobacteria bacterium]
MIRSAARAFPTLFRVGLAEAVAYRAEFLIWILATNMSLVMLALWYAVAREHPVGPYGQKQFVAYFLSVLVVRLLTGAWVVWEMNFELRQGLLAFRLLRPLHPMIHYAAENLAALPVRAMFAAPIALLSLWVMGSDQVTHDPWLLLAFFAAVLLAWLIHFLAMGLIAIAGFWIDSSLALFQVWFGFFALLSGYLLPLDLLPQRVQSVVQALPFRYMLSIPVETLLGRFERMEALRQLGIGAA